ncbi:hypothetical protein H257_09095 [Aphanomyces astaci]|uniref:DDE-1 domain-containing protein n=1 Tax=Aphanomyces astaci TaxID=112090 RepID=W4GE30_APHAT|nr:hypothetical protein H257_09095 [Aphanomyces astaci]ETV77208.1 hypothetical protein H257_09095 [Aphanomyces astaci]|eukprot:XP_009833514.1 hypothetical protein H257_09095 [Aphanomyces astaci]
MTAAATVKLYRLRVAEPRRYTTRPAQRPRWPRAPRRLRNQLWPKMQLLMQVKPTRIYGNPTAWCNDMLSIEFLRHHFGSREDMDKRVLMAWDSFSGHLTAGVEA